MKQNQIKIRRVSRLKNQFGSFAYAIVDAGELDLDQFSGVYTNENGPFLYSPNLIGEFQKDTVVTFSTRTKNSKTFLNIDSELPAWVDQVQQNMSLADRLGFGGEFKTNVAAQLASSINFGGRRTAQAVQATPAVETVVTTDEETDLG